MTRHVRALVQMALTICACFGSTMFSADAQSQPATWTQVGMLTCKLNPSIGFAIFGHQSMECRFVQNPPLPQQAYEGALNTVGLDVGITAGGVLGWAVLAPTAGPPPGAFAGTYVGATGEIGLGLGAGPARRLWTKLRPAACLAQGIGRPHVTLGISGLQLRAVY